MCGLAGIFVAKNANASSISGVRDRLEQMTERLAPRGPDASGICYDGPLALGHRRLSIMDPDSTGAQPMRDVHNGIILVYNGECYNFSKLRKELEDKGRQFFGRSDTEVVLSVYAEWGLQGLRRLEGIFAFALWDSRAQRLVLMRDRLGVKPLFYGDSEFGFAFGSEIKSVLAAGAVDTSINDQSFSEYLWYGNTHEDRTIYRGVKSLKPGHWIVIEGGNQRCEPWWKIEDWLIDETPAQSMRVASDMVRAALDKAVERQMVADVPIGLFLSGGIDSSAIAAAAAHLVRGRVDSFSAGFDFDGGISELPKAARVAKHLGLEHSEFQVSGSNLEAILIKLACAHDEPFADAANVPLFLMSEKLAGQKIKVVLQGDGGDELFGGYRRYAMLKNTKCWRLWPQTLSPVLHSFGQSGRRIARMLESVGNADPGLRMAFLLTMETPRHPPEIVLSAERRRALAAVDPFLAYRNAAMRFAVHEPVQQMLLTDLTTQLPSQFLTKVDRATMAAGIEARVPLLDENILQIAINLPTTWKVSAQRDKIVLRQSQISRLPKDVISAPKVGFGVPYEHWIRTILFDFTRSHILDDSFLRRFDLNGSVIEDMLIKHKLGVFNRGFMIWKLLQLALFYGYAHKRNLQ